MAQVGQHGLKHIAPSAASEPETRALMGLVANIKPDISYHSYQNLFFTRTVARDREQKLIKLFQKFAVKSVKSLTIVLVLLKILYGVDGGDVDWMYAAHQVILCH